ncbi:MAG TPA: kelch repeat-containing protein, partial [Gemmatimonadota bacterium]|nr:kelch repeat-containing protein [Gemmatimonadota bacterium]
DAHEAYDPRDRRWLPFHPMPTPRHGLGAAVAEGRLFAVAGASGPAGVATGANEELAPLVPLSGPEARRAGGKLTKHAVASIVGLLQGHR